MVGWRVFKSVTALACAAGLATCPQPASARVVEVSPRAAQTLRPVQLSALIASLLPHNGETSLSWKYGRSAPVRWMYAGPRQDPYRHIVQREALARVRAGTWWVNFARHGRSVEQAWFVRLENLSGQTSAPQVIEITPESDACVTKTRHPGGGFGCGFYAYEALAGSSLRSKRLCSFHGGGGEAVAFRVTAPGRQSAVLQYELSTGSGVQTAWVVIHPFAKDADVCADMAKDFG